MDQQKKCAGLTEKGEPCKKYPMTGEVFCKQHHPKTLYRRLKQAAVVIILQLIALLYFLLSQYLGCQTEERITGEFRRHSLAERILSSQYNLAETQRILEEVLNIMNNDPSFRKEFYIDGHDKLPKVRMYAHNQDFRIDFADSAKQALFNRFLLGGNRVFTLRGDDYRYFYTIKNGQVADSFANHSVRFARDFPILPPLRISTIDPTKEYLCMSMLDVQIDSILGSKIYLSNGGQDNTFRVCFVYDEERSSFSFDQLTDIFFDHSSSFYSIDQEVSYYEFMIALVSNARIMIRHASSGEEIYVTDHFIPHNIDGARSIGSFNAKLNELRFLQWIQDYWGIRFSRSDLSSEEYLILRGIDFSVRSCSRVMAYPFTFALSKPVAQKIIEKEQVIEESGGEVVSYDYSVTMLDHQLELGRLSIIIPPSRVTREDVGEVVRFKLTPHSKGDNITFEFTDLKSSIRPNLISHSDSLLRSKEPNACFVTGLHLDMSGWEYSAECEKPADHTRGSTEVMPRF